MYVEPNGLDMSKINPKRHSKYSPNLYKWLNHRDCTHRKWTSRVYRRENEYLYIGMIDEGDFIGAQLIQVLCNGSRVTGGCYCNLANGLTEITDFWPRYISDGRCAIDQDHTMYFMGDESRWRVDGDSRTCLWCGKVKQTVHRWVEPVERSEWVLSTV